MNSWWQNFWGPPGLILIGVILSAVGALWSSGQRAGFERNLRIKSEEISNLNKEIVNNVTGGDSFCYIFIDSVNAGIIGVVHKGRYPLYDLDIRIADVQEIDMMKGSLRANYSKVYKTIHIATLVKDSGVSFELPISLYGNKRDFNIFITSRNGFSVQLLRYRFINNKWFWATKVEKDGKILFEQNDDGYPRNKDREIDWN